MPAVAPIQFLIRQYPLYSEYELDLIFTEQRNIIYQIIRDV